MSELKMENYDEIQKWVSEQRDLEVLVANMQKNIGEKQEELTKLGIHCNNVTNCVDVGKSCYKCQNNYARRSYFRDLLRRGIDVSVYSVDASCFNAVKEE